MKTILLTNNYPDGPAQIVKSVLPEGFRLVMLEEASDECLERSAHLADYILASGRVKISRKVIENAPGLKMVQRTGVGLDSIDRPALAEKGIPLYVNMGVNSQSVAEHSVLLMLACLRKLCVINSNTKNGIWKKQAQGVTTFELAGKTVGMIGMGNIGIRTARLLSAFGAEILYFDQYRRSVQEEKELGINYCPLEEVLSGADIVSLHCPLTDDTRGIINKDTIDSMKDGAIIVNTARGGLIDENALLEALGSGKLSGAGLDVYAEEPIRSTGGLLSSDKVIATPHIGGVTYDSFRRMMNDAMRNIALFDQGCLSEIEEYRMELI